MSKKIEEKDKKIKKKSAPKRKAKKTSINLEEQRTKERERDDDSILKLSREDLLEAEYMIAKIDAMKAKIQMQVMKAEKLEIDTLLKSRALRNEARGIEEEEHKMRDKLSRFWNQLSEKYKVDFKKVTYDTETGIVTLHENNPS